MLPDNQRLRAHRLREHGSLAQYLRFEMVMRGITSTQKLGECIGVSQVTAWRLISSQRVPRDETLRKIATAFGVPITEVRELAERPSGEPDHFEWPPEFNQLSDPERDVLYRVGRAMLNAHELARLTR